MNVCVCELVLWCKVLLIYIYIVFPSNRLRFYIKELSTSHAVSVNELTNGLECGVVVVLRFDIFSHNFRSDLFILVPDMLFSSIDYVIHNYISINMKVLSLFKYKF